MANLKCSQCGSCIITKTKENNLIIYKCEKCGATKVVEESSIIDMSETSSLHVIMD